MEDEIITKRFFIKPGETKVTGVGFRPWLINEGIAKDVIVCPQNVCDEKSGREGVQKCKLEERKVVMVKVIGKDRNISVFWESIKPEKELPPGLQKLKETGISIDFEITQLELAPKMSKVDADYCLDALQIEQSTKFIAEGLKIIEMIENILKPRR